MTVTSAQNRLLDRRSLLYGGLLVNTLLILSLLYVGLTDATFGAPRYALYGLLWIGVGVAAAATTRVSPASPKTRRRAAAVAVGYFGLLAAAGGLVGPASPVETGVRVAPLPPGWGPALVYGGDAVTLVLMPARVVGYLALAYLVYATVVEAAGAAASGIVGLLSCVSCSWPVLASIVTGVFGGSAIVASVTTLSYDLSTLVFLVTVALLYWRPFVGGAACRSPGNGDRA